MIRFIFAYVFLLLSPTSLIIFKSRNIIESIVKPIIIIIIIGVLIWGAYELWKEYKEKILKGGK